MQVALETLTSGHNSLITTTQPRFSRQLAFALFTEKQFCRKPRVRSSVTTLSTLNSQFKNETGHNGEI